MTRNEKIEQLRAFIMKLRDIVATADVGDNCKLALPKFHKCEQNLIHFLSDAGFKHDAAVVASHANQVPATYGAPLIQTMEKDVDFYSSKLNAILDDLLNPVYTRAANLPDVPDSNLRTPTWSDIEKEVNNFESLDTDTLRAFSKVPPPPSQNPSFHAQFADTKQQIRDILQERTKLSKSASDGVANDKTEGPIRKIVVGVSIFPKPAVKKVPPECSPEILRDQLFRAGPDKGVVIKSTARTMREKFRLQEFECVFGLATVFLENDADNGHGLYFSGETWRVKAKQDPKHSDLCRD
jgi:hypothetical protein